MAALYTAAVAPTRPWLVVLDLRCLWIRPTGNCGDKDSGQTCGLALTPPLPLATPNRADGHQRAATPTCSPALWEREIAFVLVLPESFPAFPAAWKKHAFVKPAAATVAQHKDRELCRR